MKIVYTGQAVQSLKEVFDFLLNEQEMPFVSVQEIKEKLLGSIDRLLINPYLGQKEEYLEHLNLGHRRLVEGHIKIIYKIEGETIFVTDFFDSRKNTRKMKG